MPYDATFMSRYTDYVHEQGVWRAHDRALRWFFSHLPNYPDIFDLGCGVEEALEHKPGIAKYTGFDLNPLHDRIHKIDFRTTEPAQLIEAAGFKPHAIVALFSIETTMPVDERYDLYARLFKEIPSLHHILTSGIAWSTNCHWTNVYGETALRICDTDIVSYVTEEAAEDVQSDVFGEARYVQYTESELFGKECEIWKALWRC